MNALKKAAAILGKQVKKEITQQFMADWLEDQRGMTAREYIVEHERLDAEQEVSPEVNPEPVTPEYHAMVRHTAVVLDEPKIEH